MKTLFKRPIWQYRSIQVIGSLIALWLLIALIAALALPHYIKNIAIQQITAQTGRKATIDDIGVNLLTFSVYVHDFTLYDTDNTTPQFSAKELVVSASTSSLFHLAPVLDKIQLVDPTVHIVRFDDKNEGTYNFSDILNRFKTPSDKKEETPSKPFYFALNNVSIDNGNVLLEDKVTGKNIDIKKLNVLLPYFANFPSKNPITIAPSLSADVNGTPIKVTAEQPLGITTLPSKATIHLDHLDIAQYLPFVPVKLPVEIKQAEISSDLTLTFSPSEDKPSLVLDGLVQLNQVNIQDLTQHPLLKVAQAQVQAKNLDVLKLTGEISKVSIDQPEVWTSLAKDGSLNWVKTFASKDNDDKDKTKTTTDFTIKQLTINNGVAHWDDEAFARPSLQTTLDQIELNAKNIATNATAAAGSFYLSAVENKQGILYARGNIQPTTLNLNSQIELRGINLQHYSPYITPYLDAKFTGILSANATVGMKDGQPHVSNIDTTIGQFSLNPQLGGSITATTLALTNGDLDLQKHLMQIDGIYFNHVNAQVIRSKSGQINFVPVTQTKPTHTVKEKETEKNQSNTTPWKITLNRFTLDRSQVSYTDESMARPSPLLFKNITLNAQHMSSTLDQPSTITLSSTINDDGHLQVQANTTPQLGNTNVNIDLKALPVIPFQSFMPDTIKIAVMSGNISTQGKLILDHLLDSKQRQIRYQGGVTLQRFNVIDDTTKIPFLRFAELNLADIDTQFSNSRPVINVNKVNLSSFYARAVLTEKGQLNLKELVAPSADTTDNEKATDDKPKPVATQTADNKKNDQSPRIRIGDVHLSKGQINFTDNFVKPNYHVNLTGFTGTIGAIDSSKPEPAPVNINAKIDNDAPVLITGSMNPLFSPLFLDIKATATGVELPQLTPYSSKYAGYPIEKGKLSAEVNYKIQEQHLVASNEVKIDQLTFGNKVDSPDATSLPVTLAVSLLKDRNGVIDLNVPITGSLEDPQFSIGGIILKAFVNLIVKAVTSPFSLISSMFGGGEELSHLDFASGSSDITPDLIKKLDSLNYALSERPGLSLDILGKSDINTDKSGLVENQLHRQMQMLKWQDTGKKGSPLDITLSNDDEQKYLTVLYKKASFKKPSNFIGITKSEPVDEMKRLFIENTTISDQDLRSLAMDRANKVRQYIEKEGNIPNERVFLIAPKVITTAEQEKTPNMGVDFTLK